MALTDNSRGLWVPGEGEPRSDATMNLRTMTLDEMVKYDIVTVTENGILITDPVRGKQLSSPLDLVGDPGFPDMRELGGTGTSMYYNLVREEYNPELRGIAGARRYDMMRKNDGQVRATLRLIKTPILAAHWFVAPASQGAQDKKIAEFVWNNLTKWMSSSWPQMLHEMLLQLEFGYYMFEKVWDHHPLQQKVMWQKWAPRHPLDVQEWDFDNNGGPKGVYMFSPDLGASEVYIPIKKLLVFTFDKEAGMIEGIPLLRSAYKHWYYKENLYKIDAIQKERHGIGIPVIKLPPNFTPKDRSLADDMGRNLRTNEKAHIVLPPNWEIMMLKMEGLPVDALQSAEHHDMMIARNVLGQFINWTRQSGSSADDAQHDLFMKSTKYIADQIRDVINKWAIPQLVNYNWKNVDQFPELRVRRIGETVDWRTFSFAFRNFVGAGAIEPDDDLEDWLRDELDLPPKDEATVRIQVAPQMAPENVPEASAAGDAPQQPGGGAKGAPGGTAPVPGPPRQSRAGRMQQQAQGTGKNNTGIDSSGGT